MKLTFLGTGTSTGVPQVGCSCSVCRSRDSRDKRMRCSALLESEQGTRLLFDCGPDFRTQILPYPFAPIHAVLITHEHYDHVGGLDDLRPFTQYGPVTLYGEDYTLRDVAAHMPYSFSENPYPGAPRLQTKIVSLGEVFEVRELHIQPLRVFHGKLPIYGYRVENLGYVTDMSTMPDEEAEKLVGVTTLVVNALRVDPHPTHQTLEQALRFAQRVGAKHTYFTHLSHDAGLHCDVQRALPAGVHIAYDGLAVEV